MKATLITIGLFILLILIVAMLIIMSDDYDDPDL